MRYIPLKPKGGHILYLYKSHTESFHFSDILTLPRIYCIRETSATIYALIYSGIKNIEVGKWIIRGII